MEGGATAYQLMSVDNRYQCQDEGSSTVGKCLQDDSDYETCAVEIECTWDDELSKCVMFDGTDVEVPRSCEDTCP